MFAKKINFINRTINILSFNVDYLLYVASYSSKISHYGHVMNSGKYI